MKRLFAFLLIVLTGAVSVMAFPAKGFNSDPLTFFASTENMQALESYRLNQNLVGDFALERGLGGGPIKMTGEYRLKINTDVVNRSPYEADMYSFIRGHAFMDIGGADRPFDRININLWAELINIAGDGIYARLNTFNLIADNIAEGEDENYLEFKKELKEKLESVRYIWFYFPADIIGAANTEGLPAPLQSALEQEGIREELKEKGMKETYKELLSGVAEEQATDEEMSAVVQELIDEFFDTDFFTARTVVDGPQKGFTNFTLNKRKIVNFIVSAAERLGENVTDDDKTELWSMLNKFYLSSMFHADDVHGIFDFFRIKLILKDLDPIDQFSVYYSYKVSNINDVEPVVMPDEFTSYEVLQLPFLPVRRDEDACLGNEPDDCLPPASSEDEKY
ncbi:hypothetical protein JW752_02565 [Candidatus Peregrinibacteria bacterium]|nr:hypothetical protein [Candidatus Peregrinibacteria bacterium]